jgi:peroxiredoxin
MNNCNPRNTILLMLMFLASSVVRAESIENAVIPHVGKKALNSFQNSYLFAEEYKAFAIAPGGIWSWKSGLDSGAEAEQAAVAACQKYGAPKCVLYALNDQIVFDPEHWVTLWRPYLSRQQAQQAQVGVELGQRFYDLEVSKNGKRTTLSQMRGKVVIVHFWGSWCPTCCGELPMLQQAYNELKQYPDEVELVMLQVREPLEVSHAWLDKQKLSLPLYDSGYSKDGGAVLKLAGGGVMDDRNLAWAFPATYVLDKHGVVIFSHMGAILKWTQYLPFIKDAMEHSGK